MNRKLATVFAIFLVATFARGGDAQDESAIRAKLAGWVKAFNAGDLKAAAPARRLLEDRPLDRRTDPARGKIWRD